MRSDLYQVFMTYVKERPSENNSTIKLNEDTLQFLKDSNTTNSLEIKKSGNIFTIPTQIDIIQIYDTGVLYLSYTTASKMSSKILGGTAMSKVNIAEEARSIAQKYQEKPEMVNKIELL